MLKVGDCREVLAQMAELGVLFDSVVTDPPYHLESVVKRFGKEGSAPAKRGSDGLFQRQSKGFMGKEWDGGGIAFDSELWRAIYEVMKPGAYLLAFGGSRTGHRMACAIEDAGFVMHPFFGWVYSTGFPKATDPSKALAARGADPAEWGGWRHGTQSMKPALEPIFFAQKPISEKTMAENLLKWGVGCVNIDGCRVEYQDEADRASAIPQGRATARVGALAGKTQGGRERSDFVPRQGDGRWPANLLHDGSDKVLAAFLDSNKSGADSGSAARFFNATPLDGQDRLLYCAKPRKSERGEGNTHPTVKPIALIRLLVRLITPPGGEVLDPFAGSGTTALAAREEGFRATLIEKEPEYADIIRRRLRERDHTDLL